MMNKQTSVWAILSLVFSCCGLLYILGIICGHIAKKEIKNNPNLNGAGLAKAGLIIGYFVLVVNMGLFLFLAGVIIWEAPSKSTEIQVEMHTIEPQKKIGK